MNNFLQFSRLDVKKSSRSLKLSRFDFILLRNSETFFCVARENVVCNVVTLCSKFTLIKILSTNQNGLKHMPKCLIMEYYCIEEKLQVLCEMDGYT